MDELELKLVRLGLEAEEAKIYIYLHKNGSLSAMDIFRGTGILRTRVYRLLGLLIKKGLVTPVMKEYGSGKVYQANNLDNLYQLINQKQNELLSIKAELSEIIQTQTKEHIRNKPSVKYYSGIEGLKQMMWNSSKAIGQLRLYELSSFDDYLNFGFYEEIRIEHKNRNIKYYNLTNQKYMERYTNVVEFVQNCVQARYIPNKKLDLSFEFIIYNDIYAMYSVNERKEITCLEIQDKALVEMQTQIFDYIWNKSEKMVPTDIYGGCKVIR